MRVNTSAGITLDDLKAVLHNRDPDSLDLEEAKADKVAYTLLTCSTFVAPRQAGIHLPDELLECVLVPENIGQYDWAGYILEQVRAAAEKFQLAYHEEMRSFTLQGCIPLVKIFYFEWMDYGEHSLRSYMQPKICAYCEEKMSLLIRLDTDDKNMPWPKFKTRPCAYVEGRTGKIHPLIAGEGASALVEKREAIRRLRGQLDVDVGAKIQDAVITAVCEMSVQPGDQSLNEEHRAEVVYKILGGIDAQKKDLLQKFLAALYPGSHVRADHACAPGLAVGSRPSVGGECSTGGRGPVNCPTGGDEKGKRQMLETSMEAELSGDEGDEMVVLAEDDYGIAMHRMFGEDSADGGRDVAMALVGAGCSSMGAGVAPSDEAFAAYLQALLDENVVAPEILQKMTAETVLTASIPLDEAFAAHIHALIDENVVAPAVIAEMTADTMCAPVDGVIPETPRERRNNKRAAGL